jgi:hypothetical protein
MLNTKFQKKPTIVFFRLMKLKVSQLEKYISSLLIWHSSDPGPSYTVLFLTQRFRVRGGGGGRGVGRGGQTRIGNRGHNVLINTMCIFLQKFFANKLFIFEKITFQKAPKMWIFKFQNLKYAI